MLAMMKSTSSRFSRTLRVVLATVALAVLAAPVVYLSRADGADAQEPATEFLPKPSPSETRILTLLEEPTTLEFKDAPLADAAVAFLRDRHGIPVQLDLRALEDVGIGPDTPVTCNVEDVKVKSALRLLLRDMDLTYVIRNEVLLITTEDKADGPDGHFTRTYPVADLVETKGGKERDFDTLIEAITSTVRPVTWDEVGGPGVISCVPNSNSIVVSQTREVHDEILELLRALRGARRVSAGKAATDP